MGSISSLLGEFEFGGGNMRINFQLSISSSVYIQLYIYNVLTLLVSFLETPSEAFNLKF